MSSSSSTDKWSVMGWQCGMGIAQECKDAVMDWDQPKSWQSLMDQLMPIIELALVFGLQYAAASVGDGAIKAMNSLRCMLNSVVTTTWAYGAGTWQFIKYIGQDAAIKPTLDEGYGYVCTCLIDLNGIKAALGTSESSNSAFASCSEHAQYEKIKARQAADTTAADREAAAQAALLEAARKLKNWQTVNTLKRKANCVESGTTHPTLPTPAADKDTTYDQTNAEFDYNTTPWTPTNLAGCEADTLTFETEAQLIHYYWLVKTWSSGGTSSHRNKEEQTNLLEAEWVLQGIAQWKNILYPNNTKYDQWGHEITCGAGSGSTACSTEIANYFAAQQALATPYPDPVQGYSYAHKTVSCAVGNVSSGAALTVEATHNETDACALVPLKYGYYRWMHNGSITCGSPAVTGYKFCKFDLATETWVARSSAPNDAWNSTDDYYRTLGSSIASITTTTTTAADGTTSTSTTTNEGVVRDQDVKCHLYNGSTHEIHFGSANCFPVKIEGSSIRIGTQTGSAALAINESYYQWIYGGNASCTNSAAATVLGLTNCTPTLTWDSACTVSAVNKLRFNSGTTTICTSNNPTITWAAISSA